MCDTTYGSEGFTGPGPSSGGYVSIGNPLNRTGAGISGSPSPPLSYAQRIYNAMQSFKAAHTARNSTLNYGGASAGNECVATAQGVLSTAGLANIANGTLVVDVFENALTSSGYTAVTQANAQPGDIVIQSGDNHMGFCETNGCGVMISNSSSNESFTWETTPTKFEQYYGSGQNSRFYHHNP